MLKRTSKKDVKPVIRKRRWKMAHSIILGTGVLASSFFLASTISLPNPIQAAPKPFDLALSKAGYKPDGRFSYTITNPGQATTTYLTVKFDWMTANSVVSSTFVTGHVTLATGTPRVDFGVPPLQPNSSGSDFFTKPPSGAVKFRVTLDPNNKLKESNEANNQFAVPIVADVHIVNAAISAEGNLSFTVLNNGPATIQGFRLTAQNLGASSTEIGNVYMTDATTTLAPYNAYKYSVQEPIGAGINAFIHQFKFGARAVRLHLSILGTMRQASTKTSDFEVAVAYPKPTLVLTNTSYTLGSSLSYTVTNTGVWAADQPEVQIAWINAVKTVKTCIAGQGACPGFAYGEVLLPGESRAFTQPANLAFLANRPANASALTLSVRGGNGQASNCPPGPISFTWPVPDLTPISASFTPSKELHFSVKNIGPVTATGFMVGLRWKDGNGAYTGNPLKYALPTITSNGVVQDPGLALSQATYFFTVVPPGAKKLEITIDPDNAQAETLVSNNQILATYQ